VWLLLSLNIAATCLGLPVVLVDRRVNVANQVDQGLHHLVLVCVEAPVHGFDLDLGVGLDPRGDVLLGPNVFSLVVLECLLAL